MHAYPQSFEAVAEMYQLIAVILCQHPPVPYNDHYRQDALLSSSALFPIVAASFNVQPEVFDHDVCVVVRLNKPVRLFQMVCVDISECLRSSFSLIIFRDQSLFYGDIVTAFVLAQSSFLPSLTLSRTA